MGFLEWLNGAPLAAVLAGSGLLAIGVLLGLGLARGTSARRRAEELEEQLRATRARLDQQGEQIGAHFEQTAELFGDLTRTHVALYAHLAESAQDLCPERAPAIAASLELPKLAAPDVKEPEAKEPEAEKAEAEVGAEGAETRAAAPSTDEAPSEASAEDSAEAAGKIAPPASSPPPANSQKGRSPEPAPGPEARAANA